MASENNSRPVADEEATLDAIILSVQHNGRTSDEMSYLRDIVRAALARQAPAPLSQAVPEGFWLAPMEPDAEMSKRKVAGYYGVELYKFMRDSWLSRHPKPQAAPEDARDGERKS